MELATSPYYWWLSHLLCLEWSNYIHEVVLFKALTNNNDFWSYFTCPIFYNTMIVQRTLMQITYRFYEGGVETMISVARYFYKTCYESLDSSFFYYARKCNRSWSSLPLIMDWCLLGTKWLSEQNLTDHQSDPWEQTIVEFQQKLRNFLSRRGVWK